jgi:hypothetical protein
MNVVGHTCMLGVRNVVALQFVKRLMENPSIQCAQICCSPRCIENTGDGHVCCVWLADDPSNF